MGYHKWRSIKHKRYWPDGAGTLRSAITHAMFMGWTTDDEWRDQRLVAVPIVAHWDRTSIAITCPRCQRVSHHPDDVRWAYCGHCHMLHADMEAL